MSETAAERKPNSLQKPSVIFILATLVCLLWGSSVPFIKLGYKAMGITGSDTPSILLFAGTRFFGAGALVFLFFSIRRGRLMLPKKENWLMLLLLGGLQTFIHYVVYFIGVANASSVSSSIWGGMANLMPIPVACFITRQDVPSPRKWLGCALGAAGVIVMNLGGGRLSFSLLGDGMLLLTVIVTGFDTCLNKADCKREEPIIVSCWQMMLGGAMLILLGLSLGGRLALSRPGAVPVVFYLMCDSAVSLPLWAALMKENPVSAVAVYGFLVPIFGVLLSAIVLGEWKQATSPLTLIALALICAGIVIVSTKGKNSEKETVHE